MGRRPLPLAGFARGGWTRRRPGTSNGGRWGRRLGWRPRTGRFFALRHIRHDSVWGCSTFGPHSGHKLEHPPEVTARRKDSPHCPPIRRRRRRRPGISRYGLSRLSPSSSSPPKESLSSRMPEPTARPMLGRRAGPNRIRTTTAITRRWTGFSRPLNTHGDRSPRRLPGCLDRSGQPLAIGKARPVGRGHDASVSPPSRPLRAWRGCRRAARRSRRPDRARARSRGGGSRGSAAPRAPWSAPGAWCRPAPGCRTG
jgi:hypothetical protein